LWSELTPRHGREPAYEPAGECSQCGIVAPPRTTVCASCGGTVTQSLLPSLVAGKFRVEARIGAGGMGVVYRARDSFLERNVALKTLPHAHSDESARLRREARAMAAVMHPHLAAIYSLEMWGGRPILVCEYLSNGTLAQRLKSGPLSEHEAIHIGLALSGALARLHRSGILHRDIKPSNIGFTEAAEPKLLDFGLARILHADESLTSSTGGGVAGTVLYASPDVLSGGPPTTDADVWSLTMSLYEAVAGTHPYGGRDIVGTITAASQGVVPDIREFRSGVSAEIADVFRQALSRDPRQRPATATALMSLLSALIPGEREAA
jgi:serine/threonine protein kinase